MPIGRSALTVAALLGGMASSTESWAADLGLRDGGVRAGFGLNPDQVHGGLHAQHGPARGALCLRPSLELGVGNGVWLAAVNGDLLFRFRQGGGRWRPYVWVLVPADVTDGVGEGRGVEARVVFNVVAGLARSGAGRSPKPERYLVEVRIGLGDTPEVKLTLGMTF